MLKTSVPYILKVAFVVLAVALDRMGALSPALANIILTAVLGAGAGAFASTWVNKPASSIVAAVKGAVTEAKTLVASPNAATDAIALAEKALAAAKASAGAPPTGGAS